MICPECGQSFVPEEAQQVICWFCEARYAREEDDDERWEDDDG